MDNTAPAQHVLDTFNTLAPQAIQNLLPWIWTVFTLCFVVKCVTLWYDSLAEGQPLNAKLGAHLFGTFIFCGAVVWNYPTLGWEAAEGLRSLGFTATGIDEEIPIGELARRADAVTAAVDKAVDALVSWRSPLQSAANMSTVLKLRVMEAFIYGLYIIISLISVWIYSQFCIGYILGGVVIGTISWEKTREIGMKGFMYLIGSGLSLMTLAIVQGFAERVMAGAVLTDGAIASVPALSGAIWSLVVMLFLAAGAAFVTSGFMQAYAGANAPTPNIAGRLGQAGSALGGASRSVNNLLSNASSRVNSMLSSHGGPQGGGGGGSPMPGGISINTGAFSGGGAQTAGAPAAQPALSSPTQAISYLRGETP